MSAAVLKIEQLIGVIPDEQSYLFNQRHWFRKISGNVFNVWFFLFGAHGRLLSGDRKKSILKICCIVFNFNLYSVL